MTAKMELLSILNSLNNGKTKMSIIGDKLVIRPEPFAHSSMHSFLNDIQIENVKSGSLLTIKILYEGYTPCRFGGSNTTGIYLTLNAAAAEQDISKFILDAVHEQMLNLKLEFKCIIQLTIEVYKQAMGN